MHWSKANVKGEFPIKGIRSHTATVVKHKIVIIGGCDTSDNFNDVMIFDTDVQHLYKPAVLGDKMGSRRAHTANLIDKKIIVFGGGDGPHYFNDVWIFDTCANTWSKGSGSTVGVPIPRRAHTSETVNNKIYIFGGGDGVQALNDVNILDPDIFSWTSVKARGFGIPKGRGYHRSALLGKAMYVFGGSDGKSCFSDMNYFDTSSHIWHAIKCKEEGGLAHASAVMGNYIIAFGGHTSSNFDNSCKIFDIRVNKWLVPELSGICPTPRAYHTMSFCDHRAWSIGGFDSLTSFDDVGILDVGHHACQEFIEVQQSSSRTLASQSTRH